jgi:olefin beta-lactone synthetase
MNFCSPIFAYARHHPDQLALSLPQMRGKRLKGVQRLSYGELLGRVGTLQTGLLQQGYQRGDRVILVLRPCVELYAMTLALLGLGMVPVFIDAGMPRSMIESAIRAAGARALISHRRILWLTCWWPSLRPLDRFSLEGHGPGFRPLRQLAHTSGPVRCADMSAEDHGLITFTSGSTGQPKGANRTHGSLIAQHQAIRAHWPDQPDDIDMPCFPVLVLHNLCCGMTTVMPPLDLARPGAGDGAAALDEIARQGIHRLSGAPAWIEKLARAARLQPDKTRSLRDIVIGGAGVSEPLQLLLAQAFPHCHIRIVYGSTEAEPIADITLLESLQLHGGTGYPVGVPAPMCELAIVNPDSLTTEEASVDQARLPHGDIGEILVRGPHVLKGYVDNPEADRENKIRCSDGRVWHRTGDTGWLDSESRLWLAGRLKDRIVTDQGPLDVFAVEIALERDPAIRRAALVQQGEHTALFLVLGSTLSPSALGTIMERMSALQLPRLEIHVTRALPTDRRHNSKIDRVALRQRLAKGQAPHTVLMAKVSS